MASKLVSLTSTPTDALDVGSDRRVVNNTTMSSESWNFTTTHTPFITTDSDNSTYPNTVTTVTVTANRTPAVGLPTYLIAAYAGCSFLVIVLIIASIHFLRRCAKRKRDISSPNNKRVMPPSKEELRQRECVRDIVSVTASYVEFMEEGNSNDKTNTTGDVSRQTSYADVPVDNGRPVDIDVHSPNIPEYENLTPKSKQRAKVPMMPNRCLKPLLLKPPAMSTPKPDQVTSNQYFEMKSECANIDNSIGSDTYSYTPFSEYSDNNTIPTDILSQVPTVDKTIGAKPCSSGSGYINVRDCDDRDKHLEYETYTGSSSPIYVNAAP